MKVICYYVIFANINIWDHLVRQHSIDVLDWLTFHWRIEKLLPIAIKLWIFLISHCVWIIITYIIIILYSILIDKHINKIEPVLSRVEFKNWIYSITQIKKLFVKNFILFILFFYNSLENNKLFNFKIKKNIFDENPCVFFNFQNRIRERAS